MNDTASQVSAIESAVTTDHGWNPGDVQIGSVSRLDRNGCMFYRATNTARLDSQPAEYVALPDGQVVGAGETSAATVLQACGKDAPAEWWAQVITRFSDKVRGVVADPETTPSALRKIREAGGEYTPPTLSTDAGSTKITFYTMHYEESAPYEVKAVLSSDGTLRVDTRKVVP